MSKTNFYCEELGRAIEKRRTEFETGSMIERLWKKDYTIWRSEEAHKKSILNRLGWLESVDLMQERRKDLTSFSEDVRKSGFTHAVVLGMGGSSLCPDVCRTTFGSAPGYPKLFVLDSTNPTSVHRIESSISLEKTLFIVASKSGGTTETNMFYRYFFEKVGKVRKGDAGPNFIAITDAGTQMEAEATEKKFRKVFINPSDIGGRYSALSFFGLVPMAVIGMDIGRILGAAQSMIASSRNHEIKINPAALLGVTLGEAWKGGKDKLTFVTSKKLESFAYWVEQLVAESTGKEGKGILPVEGEPHFDHNSTDRIFVFIRLHQDDPGIDSLLGRLRSEGHPTVEIVLEDEYELGGEFFRWEFATAVAAVVMGINPFDEPNVKESKDNTVRVIEEFKKTGALPKQELLVSGSGVELFCEPRYREVLTAVGDDHSPAGLFDAHLGQCKRGHYVALLAYLDQNEKNMRHLQALRGAIGEKTSCATTLGFGPRYLHSTGQLHKGGAAKGLFILLTADEPSDCKIPGEPFSFEILKQAQAIGDYQSLASRSLPILRIHLGKSIEAGLETLRRFVD
ncbi:MAG TPA: hypothetical protein VMG34_00185 [Bacteroidota bacterium]|nr:hypothetical protein [Bacteroidota bacterium]